MLNAKITGIASYVPDDVLDNEELSRIVDTSDEDFETPPSDNMENAEDDIDPRWEALKQLVDNKNNKK